MGALVWLGTAAGALIAVGTVLRWTLRRTIRAGAWLAALVRLPYEVAQLADSVHDLTNAVQILAGTIHTHPEETQAHAFSSL